MHLDLKCYKACVRKMTKRKVSSSQPMDCQVKELFESFAIAI